MSPQREIEAIWRRRVSTAHRSLQLATLEVDRILAEGRSGGFDNLNQSFLLKNALMAEAQAASEYLRVLKILNALSGEGKVPNESKNL